MARATRFQSQARTHQRRAAVRMLRPIIQKKIAIITSEVSWTLVLQRHSRVMGGANLLRCRPRRKVEEEALAGHAPLRLLELRDVHGAHVDAPRLQALHGAGETR